jgi:hypothetical protein
MSIVSDMLQGLIVISKRNNMLDQNEPCLLCLSYSHILSNHNLYNVHWYLGYFLQQAPAPAILYITIPKLHFNAEPACTIRTRLWAWNVVLFYACLSS